MKKIKKDKKGKLVSQRDWLEEQGYSGSHYSLSISSNGRANLTLSDCHRTIEWEFGRPNTKRAKNKIKVLKALVDALYEHLHDPSIQPPLKGDYDY